MGIIKLTNAKEMTQNENTELEIAVQESQELSLVAQDSDEYAIVKDEKGKYKRKAKYQEYSSIKAETREEKIWLANLLDNDDDTGHGLKEQVGKKIEVANIIMRKYDKVNEDTGVLEYGVLTYLLTPDKTAYVTSSKGVYFSVQQFMKLFGTPDSPEWENLVLLVGKKKMANGDSITVKLVG